MTWQGKNHIGQRIFLVGRRKDIHMITICRSEKNCFTVEDVQELVTTTTTPDYVRFIICNNYERTAWKLIDRIKKSYGLDDRRFR